MGTNCAPLLADLFFFSYKTVFIQGLLEKNETFYRSADDVLSLNDSKFGDFVGNIYSFGV